ncbi:hypothetical protein N7539_009217 [Penicillium diatomitis]|uniref:Uncharacterized protein n=1 Tax=Penicillium diatomitis TaxID=2819901 RepID=A0A9X0BJL4_9EURO|nr:uncharacterized protein N7539_009217 [Penicillium diatomitis]KAJ5469599.1 hypothetical protein N7539_009217 [Penicillium diatomitis]
MSLSTRDSAQDYWTNMGTGNMDLDNHLSEDQKYSSTTCVFPDTAHTSTTRESSSPILPESGVIDIGINSAGLPSHDQLVDSNHVDTTGWYTHYDNCVQFFINTSQHTPAVQGIAAFLNIRLPYQRSFSALSQDQQDFSSSETHQPNRPYVSLRPYMRRMIVTAQDTPPTMSAFFGPDWPAGVGIILKQERLNYLFTAKSGGWAQTKAAYDILPDEQTPFLRPLRDPKEEELRVAEARWSEWLAMEDWMVGARSPW